MEQENSEINKVIKVIDSCKTKEQFITAITYCELWANKIQHIDTISRLKREWTFGFMLKHIIKRMTSVL